MFQILIPWGTDQRIPSLPISKGSCTCLGYTVGENEWNLEYRVNSRLYVKICKGTSETLALSIMAYGENVYEELEWFWVAHVIQGMTNRCARWRKKWIVKNTKDICKYLFGSDERLIRIYSEEKETSGLTSRFSTLTILLHVMCEDFTISCSRNPLGKWTIYIIH